MLRFIRSKSFRKAVRRVQEAIGTTSRVLISIQISLILGGKSDEVSCYGQRVVNINDKFVIVELKEPASQEAIPFSEEDMSEFICSVLN